MVKQYGVVFQFQNSKFCRKQYGQFWHGFAYARTHFLPFSVYTVTTVFLHLRLGLFPVPTENTTLVKDYCRSRNSCLIITQGNDQCTAQIPLQAQLFLCWVTGRERSHCKEWPYKKAKPVKSVESAELSWTCIHVNKKKALIIARK